MYWIVSNIGTSDGKIIHKNQFHRLNMFKEKTITKLLETGTIQEIQAPDIDILPDLKKRGTMLNKKGIRTLLDVIRADAPVLAKLLKQDVEATRLIQQQALELITPYTDKHG